MIPSAPQPDAAVEHPEHIVILGPYKGGLDFELARRVLLNVLQVPLVPHEREVVSVNEPTDLILLVSEAQRAGNLGALALPMLRVSLVPQIAFTSFPHKDS